MLTFKRNIEVDRAGGSDSECIALIVECCVYTNIVMKEVTFTGYSIPKIEHPIEFAPENVLIFLRC